MLPKANRITENREFLKIFKKVRPVHTAHLAIRATKRDRRTEQHRNKITESLVSSQDHELLATGYLLPSRFGFVISNKIDKRASRRNGLKRRIRAVVEQKMPEIAGGIDVVIQVKKPFDYPYDYESIQKEVTEGLKRIGILK